MSEPSAALLQLGGQVRVHRQQRGLTQAELAQQVSVTRSSIANLEAGRQNSGFLLVADVATALGISVIELLNTTVEPRRHRILCKVTENGPRKTIAYWCELRGCETRGRISASPHATADGIFAMAVEHHEQIEQHEATDGGGGD